MTGWTDAHCHLQDEFVDSLDQVDEVLGRASAAGVARVVVVGTDARSSAQALDVAARPGSVELWATVGLHPHQASEPLDPVLELARSGHPRLVAIGECGLDYYYEHSPRADQRRAFAAQVAAAHELDLALVIHARDAFGDLLAILASEGTPPRSVVHCFTGTRADAEACLGAGCDVSISGIVTFKNADDVREAAAAVPADRLHVETDSPFLAPAPHRGRPNEPAYVAVVGEYVAALRGVASAELAAATSANSARLFGLGA